MNITSVPSSPGHVRESIPDLQRRIAHLEGKISFLTMAISALIGAWIVGVLTYCIKYAGAERIADILMNIGKSAVYGCIAAVVGIVLFVYGGAFLNLAHAQFSWESTSKVDLLEDDDWLGHHELLRHFKRNLWRLRAAITLLLFIPAAVYLYMLASL